MTPTPNAVPRALAASRFVLLWTAAFASPPHLTDIFTSDTIGIHTFRVPNVVTMQNGTLVVIAQGKLLTQHDRGPTQVLLRRSHNNGATWSTPAVVLSDPHNRSQFDATLTYLPASDALLLVYQQSDPTKHCGACVSFVRRSTDFGRSWSSPTTIANSNATGGLGVSSGVVLTRGPHKGRVLIPQRHDCSATCDGLMNSFSLISDDNGASFRSGAKLPHGWSECQMAEMANGSVLISSRNDGDHSPPFNASHRLFARSDDGADTWAELWEAPPVSLPDPRCQAALLGDPEKGVLYFGNPSSEGSRTNYSVHVSRDGGRKWVPHTQVYAGGAAYSDMTLTSAGELACVFEKDGYKEITLASVPASAPASPPTPTPPRARPAGRSSG